MRYFIKQIVAAKYAKILVYMHTYPWFDDATLSCMLLTNINAHSYPLSIFRILSIILYILSKIM